MMMAPKDQFMPVFTRANSQDHSIPIVRTQRAPFDIHEQHGAGLHGMHHHVAPTAKHGDRPKRSSIGERLLELRRLGDGHNTIGVRG